MIKVSMKLLKKLSILFSTIIGAAALTALIILSSGSSNEKDYSEIHLNCFGIWQDKKGIVKLTETKCLFKFIDYLGFEFGEYVTKHDEVLSFWDYKNDNILIDFKFYTTSVRVTLKF